MAISQEAGAVWPDQITGPGVWTGETLDLGTVRIELTRPQKAELLQRGQEMCERNVSLSKAEVSPDRFPLNEFKEDAVRIRREVSDGCGIVLLSGFPVDQSDEMIEQMYFLLCEHIGVCVTQNCSASLVHHVTVGPKAPKMGVRTVGHLGHVGLHVDLTDVVALLCVRQNPDNPKSHAASTLALYNEIKARHPEILPLLQKGTPWSRMGEHGHEEPRTPYDVPIFALSPRGQVSCRYNRGWQERPAEGVPLPPEYQRAFDIIDSIAAEIRVEFQFKEGDIQLVSNLTAFHGRAAHGPVDQPGSERWLMRTWMYLSDFRVLPDEPLNRYGVVRHGNLGLTAQELARALDEAPPNFVPGVNNVLKWPQSRRADGCPLRAPVPKL